MKQKTVASRSIHKKGNYQNPSRLNAQHHEIRLPLVTRSHLVSITTLKLQASICSQNQTSLKAQFCLKCIRNSLFYCCCRCFVRWKKKTSKVLASIRCFSAPQLSTVDRKGLGMFLYLKSLFSQHSLGIRRTYLLCKASSKPTAKPFSLQLRGKY